MDEVNTAVRSVTRCLNRWNLAIVVLMSILHVRLAYIHVRDSGGIDRLAVA
jgi:hypothetical protein